jgi:short-subunit dehydrogenase
VNLGGRTVLLTGATGGLGVAIAHSLADRGASLVLTGRRSDVLEPLAARLGARAVVCDLADAAAVDRLVEESGPVDVLVANAGLSASGPLSSFTMEEMDRALSVNLRAPMALARRLADPMMARRSGHLVFMSSLSGKAASPGTSVYSATKFGLRGFALALRQDLRPYGVGVSVILPGFIRDAGIFHESGAELPPLTGTRSPEDVGAAVVRAIERNRAELEVAPLTLRLGASAAGLVPDLAAAVQRRFGAERIATAHFESQRHKR